MSLLQREYTLSLRGAGRDRWFPFLLLAAFAVEAMFGLLLGLDPPGRRGGLSQLGNLAGPAERDLGVFLAVVAGVPALVLAVAVLERRPSVQPGPGSRVLVIVALAAAALGAGTIGVVRAAVAGGGGPPPALLLLLAACVLGGFGAVVALGLGSPASASRSPGAPARGFNGWDLAVPAVVAILVLVPRGAQVAGQAWRYEGLIHWDWFAMGPLVALQHGRSLGSDFGPLYGAGWPLVLAGVTRVAGTSFGTLIELGSVYLVMYFAGIYVLLRLLVKPALAAAGTLATVLTMSVGTFGLYLWAAPHVTPLGWPWDVWCLIGTVRWWQTGRARWLVAAGALAGLAVVFNVTTGLALLVAFVLYCLATLRVSPGSKVRFGAGLAATTAVVVPLAVAGKGQVWSWGFWAGWLDEPLWALSLPLTGSTDGPTLVAFAAVCGFYLTLVARVAASWSARSADHLRLWSGLVAVYGLLLLTKYVHYSSEQVLGRLVIPAVVLGVVLWEHRRSSESTRGQHLRTAAGAAAVLAGLALALPQILDYPSVLSAAVRGSAPRGVCLLGQPRDICGLPPDAAAARDIVDGLAGRVAELRARGESVLVIDENGSLFALRTGISPTGPGARPFFGAFTAGEQSELTEHLSRANPDYYLVRSEGEATAARAWLGAGPGPESLNADTWRLVERFLEDHYRLEERYPGYDLWSRDR